MFAFQLANPCFGNPCLNGGSCSIVNGRASCVCQSPFIGQFCQVNSPLLLVGKGILNATI